MLIHSVDLSAGITESFFRDLKSIAQEAVTQKRLTEIIIELLQNIRKHAATESNSSLIIQKEKSSYRILSENIIHEKNVKVLTQKIATLNTLDRAELKKAHTQILGTTKLTEKSGAGLGLYRIALRSASKLVALFTPFDQHHFTFSLRVTLTA